MINRLDFIAKLTCQVDKQCEVGDVVLSPIVRFDCQKWLKKTFNHDSYKDSTPKTKYLQKAASLIKVNAGQLPGDNKRLPKILRAKGLSTSVVTTDFFGFDTSDNHYGLQHMGAVSEMGDAVLGLVLSKSTTKRRWVAVRNVSDPQIKAEGTLQQQAQEAAQIYKGFGRWSTIGSSIVCWALIAAETIGNSQPNPT